MLFRSNNNYSHPTSYKNYSTVEYNGSVSPRKERYTKENYEDIKPVKVRSPLRGIVVYSHQEKESLFKNIDKQASYIDSINQKVASRSPRTNRLILEE